ncbi:hypothetical protein ACFOS1_17705, partial [Zunongwangia endophytica]
ELPFPNYHTYARLRPLLILENTPFGVKAALIAHNGLVYSSVVAMKIRICPIKYFLFLVSIKLSFSTMAAIANMRCYKPF